MTAALLADVLDQMAATAGALVDATEGVRSALVRGDVPALHAALAQQQELASALGEQERRRRVLVAELAAELRRDADAVTASALAAQLRSRGAADLAERVERGAERVAALVERLARVNRQNRALARQGLSSVRLVLHALSGADGYGPETSGDLPALRVDRRM